MGYCMALMFIDIPTCIILLLIFQSSGAATKRFG